MNDLFYEIIMQSSVLITGLASDKAMLLYNLFLSIFGLFELPELYVLDLAGQSSKYSSFSPAIYAPSEILDTLNGIHGKMCARIDGTAHDTAKPIFLYIHNFDRIINQFYGKEKKTVMQMISDIVNRGECANLHIIITADKCTNPLFSDFKSRVYAGKTDKKTAQKYFGSVARELTNFDCSDSGQALANVSGTIYKFNVPEIYENRTEQPDLQADSHNFIAIVLYAILHLIAYVLDEISGIFTDNCIIKFAVFLALSVLYILSMPIKLLYAVATSTGSTGFSGGFTVVCMVYLISCAAVGMMG